MNAMSRDPARVEASMESSRRRVSSLVSTGVSPRLEDCLGPLTAAAGFWRITWWITSQLQRVRIGAVLGHYPIT